MTSAEIAFREEFLALRAEEKARGGGKKDPGMMEKIGDVVDFERLKGVVGRFDLRGRGRVVKSVRVYKEELSVGTMIQRGGYGIFLSVAGGVLLGGSYMAWNAYGQTGTTMSAVRNYAYDLLTWQDTVGEARDELERKAFEFGVERGHARLGVEEYVELKNPWLWYARRTEGERDAALMWGIEEMVGARGLKVRDWTGVYATIAGYVEKLGGREGATVMSYADVLYGYEKGQDVGRVCDAYAGAGNWNGEDTGRAFMWKICAQAKALKLRGLVGANGMAGVGGDEILRLQESLMWLYGRLLKSPGSGTLRKKILALEQGGVGVGRETKLVGLVLGHVREMVKGDEDGGRGTDGGEVEEEEEEEDEKTRLWYGETRARGRENGIGDFVRMIGEEGGEGGRRFADVIGGLRATANGRQVVFGLGEMVAGHLIAKEDAIMMLVFLRDGYDGDVFEVGGALRRIGGGVLVNERDVMEAIERANRGLGGETETTLRSSGGAEATETGTPHERIVRERAEARERERLYVQRQIDLGSVRTYKLDVATTAGIVELRRDVERVVRTTTTQGAYVTGSAVAGLNWREVGKMALETYGNGGAAELTWEEVDGTSREAKLRMGPKFDPLRPFDQSQAGPRGIGPSEALDVGEMRLWLDLNGTPMYVEIDGNGRYLLRGRIWDTMVLDARLGLQDSGLVVMPLYLMFMTGEYVRIDDDVGTMKLYGLMASTMGRHYAAAGGGALALADGSGGRQRNWGLHDVVNLPVQLAGAGFDAAKRLYGGEALANVVYTAVNAATGGAAGDLVHGLTSTEERDEAMRVARERHRKYHAVRGEGAPQLAGPPTSTSSTGTASDGTKARTHEGPVNELWKTYAYGPTWTRTVAPEVKTTEAPKTAGPAGPTETGMTDSEEFFEEPVVAKKTTRLVKALEPTLPDRLWMQWDNFVHENMLPTILKESFGRKMRMYYSMLPEECLYEGRAVEHLFSGVHKCRMDVRENGDYWFEYDVDGG